MRTAKISWILFALALGVLGCTKAQDKKKPPEKPGKEKKVVYEGKTVEQWVNALKDKDADIRKSAAEALGKIAGNADMSDHGKSECQSW